MDLFILIFLKIILKLKKIKNQYISKLYISETKSLNYRILY